MFRRRMRKNYLFGAADFLNYDWKKTSVSFELGSSTMIDPDSMVAHEFYEDDTAATTHYAWWPQTSPQYGDLDIGFLYRFTLYSRAVNRTWLRCVVETSVAGSDRDDHGGYFDVDTPAVGTFSGVNEATVEDMTYSWVKCSFMFVNERPNFRLVMMLAESDGDATFDGLDQLSLYVSQPKIVRVG